MWESGTLQNWLTDSVQRLNLTKSNNVLKWMVDIRLSTDTECMCVLQGKSLTADSDDVVFTLPKSFSDHIDAVLQASKTSSSNITKLQRRLSREQWKKVCTTSQRLAASIRVLLVTCSASLPIVPAEHFLQIQQQIEILCRQLVDYTSSNSREGTNGYKPDSQLLNRLLSSLNELLNDITSWTIDSIVKTLLDSIRSASSAGMVVEALGQLITAGIHHGELLCRVAASNDGIKQLVELLYPDGTLVSDTSSPSSIDDSSYIRRPRVRLAEVQAQVLRTLATLCCVEESVVQLHKAGGIDCLCDILCDGGDSASSSELVKCEAAGVLAQVTSPQFARSTKTTEALYDCFIENMADLVNALTCLCRDTYSHEVFLLSCAALANMCLLDSMTFDCLMLSGTIPVLIEASGRHVTHSLFVKDQIVTVIACMASVESCTKPLAAEAGVAELLVQYLHERPRGNATVVEQSACERLQQKAAISISRLCYCEEIGQLFIELHCVPRLVELCNDPIQRHHSNTVMLACLAALRKLCAVCGSSHGAVQSQDVKQLLHFGAVDSFLQHTSTSESFI